MPSPSETISPNPILASRCGLDISLLVDRSGSIGEDNSVVAQAEQGLVDALKDTGSRIKLASFADDATVHPFGHQEGDPNQNNLNWSVVENYTVPTLPSAGGTNLEGGLEVLRRSPGGAGDLLIIFTDGKPNLHYLDLGNGHPGPFVNLGSEQTEATAEANKIKASGTHVLAIGVGDATTDALQAISGTNEYAIGNPVQKADFMHLASFTKLPETFRSIAASLCSSSVEVHTHTDGEPVAGIEVTVIATPAPVEWLAPPEASGDMATVFTDEGGIASFSWRTDTAGTDLYILVNPTVGYWPANMTCEEDRHDGAPRVPLFVLRFEGRSFAVMKSPGSALYCEAGNDLGGTAP
jgi:hypothetical protein